MISLIWASPLLSGSQALQVETGSVPRAMFTQVMISLICTSPLPLQSPTQAEVGVKVAAWVRVGLGVWVGVGMKVFVKLGV